jgi:lambda family phage tail tape measure protein
VPGVYAAKVYLGALGKGPVAKQSGNGNGNGNGGGGGDIPGLTGGSGGTGKKTGADKAAAEAKRLAEEQAKQLLASQKALAISQAELTVTQTTNALEKAAAEYALQKLRIEQDFAVKLADTKQLKDGQVKQEIISNIEAAKRNELEKARLGYLEQQTKELLRQAGIDNPDFGKKPTGVDPKDTYKYKPSPGTGLQGEDRKKIDEEYNKIKERLNDLMNPANQIIGAANAIGDAFATSFEGMISGAMTAKQALASFFKDLASYFTKMATQMIADALRMAAIKILTNILSSVLGGFGGGGGGTDLGKNFNSAGAGDTGISWGAAVNYKRNALGNVYGANGIVPFADGGIVNQPTLFKFAQGGAMQNGLMGEAGPEAIMPLKRGADGKLGVVAGGNGGSTTINVSVDAKGSSVQGDGGKGDQLGRVIAVAVQQEMIKQKRPGGILA